MFMSIRQMSNPKYMQAQNENLGMSWFFFTINFRLFASMAKYIFDFLAIFTIYTDTELTFLMGIICILLLAANLYVRYSLANFRRNAIKIYFILCYGVDFFFFLLNMLIAKDLTQLTGMITLVICFIPEFIYYRKRAHLFDTVRTKKEKT